MSCNKTGHSSEISYLPIDHMWLRLYGGEKVVYLINMQPSEILYVVWSVNLNSFSNERPE